MKILIDFIWLGLAIAGAAFGLYWVIRTAIEDAR
jgi:hypothetical protein